ncbi:MAG: VCBS repeat-containing protein, partial [Patescibacteria group bacterium]
VRVIDPVTKKTTKQFNAFAKSDRNGINVAAGDVTGDHQADVIVGTGAGTDPLVKVFTPDGRLVTSFNPYFTERKTGVAVAAGDVNADGVDELITVPAKSYPQIRIWTYNQTTKKFTSLAQGFAYDRTQRQGYSIATGDLDGDARAEIIVAPRLNGRSVTILNLNDKNELKVVRRFNPYPIQFTSGLTVASGDVFGTGRANIITVGGPGYYSDINVFDINGKLRAHFLPTSKAYRGGVTLTVLDVNRDGREEIVTGTYRNGDPGLRVFRYSGLKKKFEQIQNYFVFPRTVKNGLRLGST